VLQAKTIKKSKDSVIFFSDIYETFLLGKKYYPISKAGVTTIYPGLDDNAKLTKLVEAYNQLVN